MRRHTLYTLHTLRYHYIKVNGLINSPILENDPLISRIHLLIQEYESWLIEMCIQRWANKRWSCPRNPYYSATKTRCGQELSSKTTDLRQKSLLLGSFGGINGESAITWVRSSIWQMEIWWLPHIISSRLAYATASFLAALAHPAAWKGHFVHI